MIKGHVICAYLGFNTVAIQRQLMGIPQLITEMEGIKHICTWSYTMHLQRNFMLRTLLICDLLQYIVMVTPKYAISELSPRCYKAF
jgi:hypothetical protein